MRAGSVRRHPMLGSTAEVVYPGVAFRHHQLTAASGTQSHKAFKGTELEFVVRPPLGAGPDPGSERPNAHR